MILKDSYYNSKFGVNGNILTRYFKWVYNIIVLSYVLNTLWVMFKKLYHNSYIN